MENLQAVIDAARQGVAATKIETIGAKAHYLVATADGSEIQVVSLEDGLPSPLRKRGLIKVFDAPSFNAILEGNATAGNIVIYVDRDANNPRIIAVMNDQGPLGAGWGDFRAEIIFRATPQWLKWKAIDGKLLSQLAFAEFIEDNLGDIVEPAGALMLEIAQDLSAKRSVDFKSNVRLQDGRIQFQNIENMEAQVGAGQIGVPASITLGIAPVIGIPPFRIDARFRYRVENGKLSLGIKLQRVEDIMRAVVNDMVEGTVSAENRPAVIGIMAPDGAIVVEGIAPDATR